MFQHARRVPQKTDTPLVLRRRPESRRSSGHEMGIARLPLFLQPKLTVSQSGDPAELEADRVADQVLRTPEPTVQRKCAACAGGGPCPTCDNEQRELIHRQADVASAPLTSSDAGSMLSHLGSGQLLDRTTRAYFEPRFGRDFSRVRVHAGPAAEQSARDVNALAYTVGQDMVFGAGRFTPGTHEGQRLIAHELVHVVQQSPAPALVGAYGEHGLGGPVARALDAGIQRQAGSIRLQRQCDPAWGGMSWAQRVNNARAAAASAMSNHCLTDMLDEALTANVTVDESTNTAATVNAAAVAGQYTEWGTLSDLHINFDRNLNTKTGNPNQFGETTFISPLVGSTIRIFIVLGPRALDQVGPQHTQMAAHHEGEHAFDFLLQWASIGGTPHGATPGEELKIHSEGFSLYFLDLWTIDNTALTFRLSNDFFPMFTNFPGATPAEQDSAFDSIRMFYDVRITGIPCNLMKFKIWLQMMQNARPASDALVVRINALSGLGLTRGTSPGTHFNVALACS